MRTYYVEIVLGTFFGTFALGLVALLAVNADKWMSQTNASINTMNSHLGQIANNMNVISTQVQPVATLATIVQERLVNPVVYGPSVVQERKPSVKVIPTRNTQLRIDCRV